MKFKVGDNVMVTAGKDKGLKAAIIKTYPKNDTVIVEGANMYTRHYKPTSGQPGRTVRKERPLPTAKIAIINNKGAVDRVRYQMAKDASKTRVFAKTGAPVPEKAPATKKSKA